MLVSKRFISLFVILLLLSFHSLQAQLKQISSKYVTALHLFENELWYIENGEDVQVLDLKTNEDLTVKYKSYTKTLKPIASNGAQLWLYNFNNIVVLSDPKNKRYSTAKDIKGIDHGSLVTQNNFIPFGDDQVLIRGNINKAQRGQAPLMVKANLVLDTGKPEEISSYVPAGVNIDFFDYVYRPGKGAYVTDGWNVFKKEGKKFTPIDLSSLDGFKDVRLGKIATDGSLWAYQDGVGIIHFTDKVEHRYKLNPNDKKNDYLSKKRFTFLEVMDNGLVILATESEIWILENGKFSPFDLENQKDKINLIRAWGNYLLVARNSGLTIEKVY